MKEGEDFSTLKLQAIADALGIKREFLENKEIDYKSNRPIPEDALATPTPITTTTTPSDITEMLHIFERQAADIKKSKEELRDTEFNAMKEMQRQMAELLQEVSGNTRVMSENVLALAEIVKELKEERGGEHDPD